MCGRFTLTTDLFNLKLHFSTDLIDAALTAEPWRPRFNIAPTQLAPIVTLEPDGKRRLRLMKWGLVPSWSTDPKLGAKMINARAETVAEKPSFRKAFAERRCLVPVDGFYEWRKDSEKQKTPMWIHRPDKRVFAFAGLWEIWKDRGAAGAPLETFTILTTEASPFMSAIHDRMPVILDGEGERTWLAPEATAADRQALLKPLRAPDGLSAEAVSTVVNSPRNDTDECIRPL